VRVDSGPGLLSAGAAHARHRHRRAGLLPPAVAAMTAILLAPDYSGVPGHESLAPRAAYMAGALGTLLGADLAHLLNRRTLALLDAPLLSIGGAGTFDGIFLAGIIAVLLA